MIVVPVVLGVALIMALARIPIETVVRIVENHFAAIVGLPAAGLASAFVVIAFEYSSGPVKLKGAGFEFEGAAGQVVLWVLCFLSLAGTIRLVWNIG